MSSYALGELIGRALVYLLVVPPVGSAPVIANHLLMTNADGPPAVSLAVTPLHPDTGLHRSLRGSTS